MASGINDQKNGFIALVMPRLHEEELAGYFLEACGWHHLSLPALSETDLEIVIGRGQIEHFLEGFERDTPARLIDYPILSRVDCVFCGNP